MSSDLKAILQLPEAKVTQPNVQVEEFGHVFRQQIDGVNRQLRVLTAQASPAELQPFEDQRQKLMEAFQKTAALVDPADPTKAGKAIDRVMAAVDVVGGKATEAAAGVLAGHDLWLEHEAELDEVLLKIGELEEVQHPKAVTLRKLGEAIRSRAHNRQYQEAVQALEQLRPKLEKIYAEASLEPTATAPGASAPPQENPYRDQVLRPGANGDAVKQLQQMLVAQGAQITVDGAYGPATAQAVAAFQRSVKLPVDGVVGPQSWSAFESGGGGEVGSPSVDSSQGGNGMNSGGTVSPAVGGVVEPQDNSSAMDLNSSESSGETHPPISISGIAAQGEVVNAAQTNIEDDVEIDTEYATITKDGVEFKVGKDLVKEAYNKVIARPYGVPVVLQFGAEIKIEFKVPVKKDKGITGASLGITAGAKAALAAGLVNAGFEGRVPKEGLSGEAAKYLNMNIFGNFSMATNASTGVKLEQDQWIAELFHLEVVGGFAVGVQVVDIVEQYKFGKFSLGSLSIGWSENGQAFIKGKSAGESSEMTAVLEDLIRKVKAKVGEKVEELVDRHAPEALKDNVDQATKWSAESEGGKQVADTTQDGLDALDKLSQWSDENLGTDLGEAGTDVGNWAEKQVRDFGDPNGETSQEATDRVNEENRRFDVSHADFVDTMIALGLRAPGGKLVPFRSSDEYNKVHEVWRQESEKVAKGGKPSGKWKGMAQQLRKSALAKWKKKIDEKKAQQEKQVKEQQEAEKKQQEKIQQLKSSKHAAQMAMGKCNGCNAKGIPIQPAASQAYSKGFAKYTEAGSIEAAEPSRAINLYQQAIAAFQEGDGLQG